MTVYLNCSWSAVMRLWVYVMLSLAKGDDIDRLMIRDVQWIYEADTHSLRGGRGRDDCDRFHSLYSHWPGTGDRQCSKNFSGGADIRARPEGARAARSSGGGASGDGCRRFAEYR